MADSMRQALGAAEAGDESEIYLGLPEARFFTGDDQVASERELESAAERKAIDRRDDGNRQVLETLHHAMPQARKIESVNRRHLRHRGDIRTRHARPVLGAP